MAEILHQLIDSYLIIYKVLYIPGRAGFLPSTATPVPPVRKGHFYIFFLSSKVPPTHPPSHRCLDLDLSFPARSKLLRRGQKLGSPGNE